jgi:hypothetical protein
MHIIACGAALTATVDGISEYYKFGYSKSGK